MAHNHRPTSHRGRTSRRGIVRRATGPHRLQDHRAINHSTHRARKAISHCRLQDRRVKKHHKAISRRVTDRHKATGHNRATGTATNQDQILMHHRKVAAHRQVAAIRRYSIVF